MRILIHTPKNGPPEFFSDVGGDKLVRWYSEKHTVSRERLGLMSQVWRGKLLYAQHEPTNLDFTYYAPERGPVALYIGRIGRPRVARFAPVLRRTALAELVDRLDMKFVSVVDLDRAEV